MKRKVKTKFNIKRIQYVKNDYDVFHVVLIIDDRLESTFKTRRKTKLIACVREREREKDVRK